MQRTNKIRVTYINDPTPLNNSTRTQNSKGKQAWGGYNNQRKDIGEHPMPRWQKMLSNMVLIDGRITNTKLIDERTNIIHYT